MLSVRANLETSTKLTFIYKILELQPEKQIFFNALGVWQLYLVPLPK